MVAERIQQERAEQRRLEREERKVWAEAERLRWEIEEAERERCEVCLWYFTKSLRATVFMQTVYSTVVRGYS